MVRGIGAYNGDELGVTFVAECDNPGDGVSRTPRDIPWRNITIKSISILGVDVLPDDLPNEVIEAIRDLAMDQQFWSDTIEGERQ